MVFKIVQYQNNINTNTFQLNQGESLVIGRKGQGVAIAIDNDTVSRKQAKISLDNDSVILIDTASTNGTFINEEQINSETPYILKHGDTIRFGKAYSFKFEIVISSEKIIKNSISKNQLLNFNDKSLLEWFKEKQSILIGRNDDSDFVISDSTVSRKHAKLYKENNDFWLEDLNSTNGTIVNGERIFGKVKLSVDDTIFIGLYQFKFNEKPKDLNRELAIQVINLEKIYNTSASGEKMGLQSLSFEIPKQEFVALMGPSGCGKSTLLKALNGDNPATAGKVLIHGLELASNFKFLKRKFGYVPQDDIVHKELSVEKSLYYAAKLRMGDGVSEEVIAEKITEVLSSLNINNPDLRQKQISELSGGQRKRVSIAVELLNNPSILFLDEPTSPLDPETIEEFLKCIKNLTLKGTTVIMVTHKPEDLNYVDKVIFLSTKGYFAYYGNKGADVLDYFGAKDIIGIYSLLNKPDNTKVWYDKCMQSLPKNIPVISKPDTFEKTKTESFWKQLFWLSARYFNIKINDRINTLLIFAQPVIIAGLVAFIFKDLDVGILFLMAISAIWFGVSNSCKEIVGEMPIYRRERMFNLRISTYLLSKIIVLIFFATIQVIIFVSIIYLRFRFDKTPCIDSTVMLNDYLGTTFFMLLLSFSATLMGLFISSVFNNTEKVMTIVPIALMPQIMLAGVVTKLSDQFTVFLSYFTLGRWGTEGLSCIQDQYSKALHDTGSIITMIPKQPEINCEYQKKFALDLLDFYPNDILSLSQSHSLSNTLIAILVINVVIFASIFIALKRKDSI